MNHPSQLPGRRRSLSLLAEFFSCQSERRSEATQERYLRVHQHLHGFLAEGDMAGLLTPHESARLSDGRNSGRHFLDVLTFDQLVVCLPRFVEPPWLMAPPADARAQIALAARLIKWLDASGLLAIDACSFLEASAAVRKAQQRRGRGSRSPADESRARLTLLQGGLADR